MPRAVFLCLACATALHVQRRALLAPAVAGAIGIAPANAGLIDFDPEAAKAADELAVLNAEHLVSQEQVNPRVHRLEHLSRKLVGAISAARPCATIQIHKHVLA